MTHHSGCVLPCCYPALYQACIVLKIPGFPHTFTWHDSLLFMVVADPFFDSNYFLVKPTHLNLLTCSYAQYNKIKGLLTSIADELPDVPL